MMFGQSLSTHYATRASGLEDPRTPLDPDFDDGENSISSFYGDGFRSDTGLKITRKLALGYAPYFRSLSLLSGDTGRCPLVIYRKVTVGESAGKEKAIEHPAYKLLRRRPNKYMTANVWKRAMVLHACDKGNGYSFISRSGDGTPVELLLLDPDRTWPVRVNGELYYLHQLENGEWRKLAARDVLHLKNVSWDGLCGMGWREVGKETLGMGIASRKFSTRFYRRGAVPSVVLEAPGKMSPKVVRQLRKDWETLQSGLENMHRTAILQQGTKAHTLSQSAKDSQMAEMQMFNVRMTSTLTGVPPHKLGDSTRSSYNSLEQENQSYLNEALDCWLVDFEEECEDKLLTEEELAGETHCIEFNRKVFMEADVGTRYASYATGKQNRFLTTNEIRSYENLNPIEGGDELDDSAQVQGNNPQPAEGEGSTVVQTDGERFDNLKIKIDAYGVAVRAGVITPTEDDEDYFRTEAGLPAMSQAVKESWQKDQGTRRPITLVNAQAHEQPNSAGNAMPTDPTDNGAPEDAD